MPIVPSDAQLISDAMNSRLLDVWTSTIGRVESYDPATQTASVRPVVRRPLQAADGAIGHEDLPVVPNVPVLQPRSGGFFVHLPVAAGDAVLLVFTTDSFALWRESGDVVNPGDLRRHNLSNAIAIPGLGPASAALPNIPTNEAVLGGGVFRVGTSAADFVALSTKVNDALEAIRTWANSHTHGTAMGPSATTAPTLAALASTASTRLKSE